MNQRQIVRKAEARVKKLLTKDSTGHDWHHIERVRAMALRIAAEEKVDQFLVELMVLLHELPDKKLKLFRSERHALAAVGKWLRQHELPSAHIEEILYVISRQSYSKSGVTREKLESRAGQVAQDADRLDAIGAIGVARCFAYGAKAGRPLHDPAMLRHRARTEYQALHAPSSISHIYEKLLQVKNLMNTPTAQRLAANRHRFLETFLAEFLAEWDGQR